METEQFEALMMYVLVGGLIVFMFFIIWDLAKKSKAGRLGTAVLFLTLGLCLFAFFGQANHHLHHRNRSRHSRLSVNFSARRGCLTPYTARPETATRTLALTQEFSCPTPIW